MIFSLIINGAPFVLSPLLDVRHKNSNFGCCFCLRKIRTGPFIFLWTVYWERRPNALRWGR